MKKIAVVFGTRPETIKMAPLVHALRERPELFNVEVWVTAQHRQMLDQALEVFDITPDVDMDLMKSGQDLFDITTSVLEGMKTELQLRNPDVILVHGDTTTALASAIAGYYTGTSIGHVEAGLRTNDIYSPFPEEFNRQVVSRVATWHFAPTQQSKENLLDEKINESSIVVSGNTIIDSLFWVLAKIEKDVNLKKQIEDDLDNKLSFSWKTDQFVLITGHRRENFGKGFEGILEAIKRLSKERPSVHFVFPVHLNPAVYLPVHDSLGKLQNVHLIEPLEYQSFSYLMQFSYLVLTDSGGVQEEAPSLGKPVLVMRDVTERPEAVNAGTAELVGSTTEKIISSVSRLLDERHEYEKMSQAHNPYGDGTACAQIVNFLAKQA